MDLLATFNKGYLIKWGLVSISLLFNPYLLFPIMVVFSVLYFRNKVQNIDLIILIFVSFLIYDSLNRLGAAANIRFSLIGVFFIKNLIAPDIRKRTDSNLVVSLLIFLLYIFFNALLISVDLSTSMINFAQFTFFLIFIFISTNFRRLSEFIYIYDNIYNFFIVILLLSLLSFPIPEISFARNGTGFQGITLHPNMYGLFMAPFCGLALVQFIVKRNKLDLLLFIGTAVTLFMSQSRTSLLSVVLGLILYLITNREFRQYFSRTILIILMPLLLVCVLFYEKILSYITSFLAKNAADQNIIDSFERSRGSIIETQLLNISDSFWMGIGFKIPSDKILTKIEGTDTVLYEKGNIFLATVEELGFMGLILFLFLIYSLLLKNKMNIIFTIVPMIFIFTTAGEATLFSMGGAGFLIWVMLFINYRFQNNFMQTK